MFLFGSFEIYRVHYLYISKHVKNVLDSLLMCMTMRILVCIALYANEWHKLFVHLQKIDFFLGKSVFVKEVEA